MLRILYGSDWQSNADYLLDELCREAAAGKSGQILIVPEQFSFDAEMRLCRKGGDAISRFAEVLSFTRLYDRVCSLTGGAAVQIMDRAGRLIAMAGALEQVRSRLKLYGAHACKPEFLLGLLSLYEEFQSYGVSFESLKKAGSAVEGQLAEKLEELALLLESYESVCKNAVMDPSTRLSRLADKLHETELFRGRAVYIDGFSDFTSQELDVIKALLSGGAELTVSLCCDDLRQGRELFSVTRETAKQLLRLEPTADLQSVEEKKRTPGLGHLKEYLFSGAAVPFPEEVPLTLTACESRQQQALAALTRIQQLVRNGVRWREIAIACTDPDSMQPVLEQLFARYRIPSFFAGNKALLQTPVVRMLLSALRAATGRMEREDVLDYLKSGFAPISREDCDLLENYAVVWELRGNLWNAPFANDPKGFDSNLPQEKVQELLSRLNLAREAAVVPLLQLRQRFAQAADTAAQCEALAAWMEQIHLSGRLSEEADRLRQQGDFHRAQQTGQIYELLLVVLEQMHGVLGRSQRTPEEFYRFFRAALSQQSVGSIPATLDCVHVGAIRDLRNNRAPHLFVLDASDGLLPLRAQQTGLFSQTERKRLASAGLQLAPDESEQLSRELLIAYTVLISSERELHLTCQKEEPSYLFLRLQSLFPKAKALESAPLPATAEQAAVHLAKRGSLSEDPLLFKTLQQLKDRTLYQPGRLQRETVTGLYGREFYLSASRVDKFYNCPMAYFLQYGLKADERRPAEISQRLFGTFLHDVLEHVGEQVMQEGGFHRVSEERLTTLTEEAIEQFVQTQLTGISDLSERARYLFRRRFEEVLAVVRDLGNELRQSEFEPVRFELPFTGTNAVRIEGETASAKMHGYVDRVDAYDAPDGRRFIRVVDYKSGKKDFDFTDILEGLGLQMLIYLFALKKRGKQLLGSEVEEAGVLYMPAQVSVLAEKQRLSESEAAAVRQEAFRRKGLILDDERIRLAMEPKDPPDYLPCTTDRSGNRKRCADRAQFRLLEEHVSAKLEQMVDRLSSGETEPEPYARGSHSPCSYCEFSAVCHTKSGAVQERQRAATSEQRFWEELERRDEDRG